MWDETKEKAEFEFGQLRKLIAISESFSVRMEKADAGQADIMAMAVILHSFYSGIENIFERIAKEIDNELPRGPNWHSDLLVSMTRPNNQRPAVVSEDMAAVLKGYLGFRHTFRNIYIFNLELTKMRPLILHMRATFDGLEKEIRSFFSGGKKES